MTFQPIKTVSLLALAIAGINSVHANNSAANTDGVQQLQTVVVTATRTEQLASETLAAVTVIDRQEIERLQAHDLADLIRRAPGISINRQGPLGSAASVSIRGGNSNHTLFLVDGQRISSMTLGSAELPPLDVNQIERIEIVRGPKASLYGADAVGGVIHVITRQGGSENGWQPTIKQSIGNRTTRETQVALDGKHDNFRMSVAAKYFTTDGISASFDNNGLNGDEDAFRSRSLTAAFGYQFDTGADVLLTHYDTRTNMEFDSDFYMTALPTEQPFNDTDTRTTTLRWIQPVTDYWTSTASLGRAKMISESRDKLNDLTFTAFNTERDQVSWQNDFRFATGKIDHVFTAGVDYYNETLDSTSFYFDEAGLPVTERDNTGYFVQNQMSSGRHQLILALRQDDHEGYGKNDTGSISYGYQLTDNLQIVGSYGTAFKAPTFNDLYWPAGMWTGGNPHLAPEKSENYEIGLKGSHYNVDWSFNLFDNKIEDLIEWAQVPGTWYYEPRNVDKSHIKGAEVELVTYVADWKIDFNTTYVDARYDGDDDHGNIMSYRPRLTANLDISRRFNQFEFGAEIQGQSSRYINRQNTDELQGHHLLNLRGQYDVNDQLSLQLKLTNVLDRDYTLVNGYNTEGFGAMLTAIYRPQF